MFDAVFDGGMGGEVGAQPQVVGGLVESTETLEQADRAGRVEAGRAHEKGAKGVRFKLVLPRVGAFQPLEANLPNPGSERASARGGQRRRREGRLREQPVDCVAPDHMGHLVGHHEGHFVPVVVAQFHQRPRHEDESARQGEGRRMFLRHGGHPKAV